jgi:Uncharacterized conserved protein (DUF2285)
MLITAFETRPPQTLRINGYHERHFVTYLRMLDATAEGADWREIVAIVFGLDPNLEPERARTVYESHLDRALWMARSGYRQLLVARLQ